MSWEFINQRIIKKTRKSHKCVCCGRAISPGSTEIRHFSGKIEGDFQSSYECNWCEDNSDELLDDEYYRDFWEAIQDMFYDTSDQYKECDCTVKHGLAGNIEYDFDKNDPNYLAIKCENCGKVWHKEHMPVCRGGKR